MTNIRIGAVSNAPGAHETHLKAAWLAETVKPMRHQSPRRADHSVRMAAKGGAKKIRLPRITPRALLE